MYLYRTSPMYHFTHSWSQLFFKIFIYLFLEEGKGGEKERETSIYGCLSCAPYWGPGPQPRHAPWLGIKPPTLWFTGWCSIHWATPARAWSQLLTQLLVWAPVQPRCSLALNHLYLYLLLPWSFPVAKVRHTCRTHSALGHMLARSAGKLMSVELPLTNEGRALVAKCFPLHLLMNSSGPPLISFFSRFKQQSLWRPTLLSVLKLAVPCFSFPSFPLSFQWPSLQLLGIPFLD